MSDICIVGLSNIKHISLISLYTKYFDENNISYDIIYIDKYGIEERTNASNQISYKIKPVKGRFAKVIEFLKFRRFTISHIKKNNYKLLILWQATAAYLFADFIISRFKNRYVINIRDYIMEKNPIIKFILPYIIKKSAFVTISSEGFKEFLPSGKYIRVNSINEELLFSNCFTEEKQKTIPFKIGFVGNCRFFRESFKLIDALANDSRFELWYCGTNSEILKEYAKGKNINNVYTISSFEKEDTIDMMNRFDIINSAFGNDAMDNRTLMPIRLYTAVSLNLPILVSSNTQLSKEVEKNAIGFVIKDFENLPEKLYKYLVEIDRDEFNDKCEQFLKVARDENESFYIDLRNLLEEIK